MLYLTRKTGQSITIQPQEGLDFTTSIGELFSHGPIEIKINRVLRDAVRVGIEANRQLCIHRDENLGRPDVHVISSPKKMSSREILATNVFSLRTQKQWNMQDLAEKSNLAVTTICALEMGLGEIDLEELDDLASALHVSVGVLLRG
jgi:sRNA-binding carbon storage regulator CsrA